MSTFTYSL